MGNITMGGFCCDRRSDRVLVTQELRLMVVHTNEQGKWQRVQRFKETITDQSEITELEAEKPIPPLISHQKQVSLGGQSGQPQLAYLTPDNQRTPWSETLHKPQSFGFKYNPNVDQPLRLPQQDEKHIFEKSIQTLKQDDDSTKQRKNINIVIDQEPKNHNFFEDLSTQFRALEHFRTVVGTPARQLINPFESELQRSVVTESYDYGDESMDSEPKLVVGQQKILEASDEEYNVDQLQDDKNFNTAQTQRLRQGNEVDKKVGTVMDRLINATKHMLKASIDKGKAEGRQPNKDVAKFLSSMKMKDLELMMLSRIPCVKIEDSKFLIGASIKTLEIKGQHVMVRVGGGFEELQEFLAHQVSSLYSEIFRLMEAEGMGFVATICRILKKQGSEPDTIKEFKNSVSATQEKNIMMTINAYREKQQKKLRKMRRSSVVKPKIHQSSLK